MSQNSNNSSPLSVRIGSGTFYLTSKTNPGEGWREETVNNPSTNQPVTRFRKDISVVGKVNWVGLQEDKFKGLCLSILIKGEEGESYNLNFPVINGASSVKATDAYFNSVVGAFENVNKGDTVTMFLNNKNKDKDDRLYKNVVVLDAEGKLIKSNFSFSDVPKWASEETTDFTGKKTVKYDPSVANKFYYDKAVAIAERFKSEPKKETPSAPNVNNDDLEEELPFN